MEKNRITAEEAADILRGMLDEEQEKSERLHQRNKTLELLLLEHDRTIPDYDSWHNVLPMD